jgi:amino acid transporter
MGQAKPPVFLREATGLIREVGAWPSFMATVGLVTGGVPVLWVATMYTAPGANWPEAFFVAFLPTLTMAGLFTIIGISMPRSGGDYVFTTRGLNPYVGFLNYWGVNIAYILNLGIFAYYGTVYFGYLLSGLGAFYANQALANLGAWLTTTYPSIALGAILIVALGLVAMVRPRYSWAGIFWSGVVSLIALVVMFVALASFSQTGFVAAYNSFMGNSTAYQAVIAQGAVTPPSNTMLATAAALPFTWFAYTWYNLPASWSGEVKHVKRSMPIAILLAMVVIAIFYIALAWVVTNCFGESFLENWSSLAASGTAPVPGIGGFIPFFALLVYKNVPLYFVMFVALWLPDWYSLVPLTISQTRYLFAMSFDRILPEKVASVSESLHTPVVATILVMIGGMIGLSLMAILPNSGEFATAMFAVFTFGFIIPAITGVVFPFRRKQIYEDTFVAKKKFVLPLLSWLGLGSAIYLIYSTWLSHQSGSLPTDTFTLTLYGIIYGIGILVLVIGYLRTRAKGLPLYLVFKEIPPE